MDKVHTITRRKPLTRTRGTPVKRSVKRVKAKKAPTPAKLKKLVWEECKRIIRKQYGNTCYTCKVPGLTGSNWHTGHFIASSICGGYLRYDLRNLRPQCYRCNISLSGSGAVFYRNLVSDMGQEYVDQLFRDKNKIIKLNSVYLTELLTEYGKI